MDKHLGFLVLGLGAGGVYAALGVALVVTYRSSRTINLATGAMAMYAAYTYAFLRQGQLFIILPGLPKTVRVADSLPFAPAFLLSVLMATALGMLLYVAAFRRLRTSSPVIRMVASIGVTAVLQGLMAQRLGTDPVGVGAIFPRVRHQWASIPVPADRLYLAVTIAAVVVALGALFRYTRFGLATRAVAESEQGALVTGLSPSRIAMINWGLSGAVAGVAGILISPVVPLTPSAFTLFIVPSLAAALLGRLNSLTLAAIGGLVIGMLQSEAGYVVGLYSWLPKTGVPDALPLLVIVVMLAVGAGALPARGAVIERNLGAAPRPQRTLFPGLIGVAIALAAILLTQGGYRAAVTTSLILAVLCLSIVVITGFVGQISLAQVTLAGAGAFLTATVVKDWGLPFPITPLVAAMGAAVLGVAIGLPSLRVRGLSFVAVTLALAVGIEGLWFRNDDFNGGLAGARVANPTLFGFDLGVGQGQAYPRVAFAITALVALAAVAVAVSRLRLSALGARMLAVRSNERAAAAAGIHVASTKVVAFAIASFIAGLGGAMLAYQNTVVSAPSYAVLLTFGLVAAVFIAGVTTVAGGILAGVIAPGGFLSVVLDRQLELGGWFEILAGIGMVMAVTNHPNGIAGGIQEWVVRRRDRRTGSEHLRQLNDASSRAAEQDDGPALEHDGGQVARYALTGNSEDDQSVRSADPLVVSNIEVRYGGIVAVDGVSFRVEPGQIVGVIGPNGAGKTTLLDAIGGFQRSSGEIHLGERRLDQMPPHKRSRAGLGRTFQGLELYDKLTVVENVSAGCSTTGSRVRRQAAIDRTLSTLGLQLWRDRLAEDLSQGQRQLVSVARALVNEPRVLLLDEPAAGLDLATSAWLADRLRAVRSSGVTIVLIDHNMNFVMDLCEHIHVLSFGKIIASGPPDRIRSDVEVRRAYLGDIGFEPVDERVETVEAVTVR